MQCPLAYKAKVNSVIKYNPENGLQELATMQKFYIIT
jgi:hypothetical protein